jgi:dipeptidase D
MPEVLTALTPSAVWRHFEALTRIPRPSGREEAAAAYVREVAAAHGFPVESDQVGNLVVRVPASPGHESAPVVALQGHLDMVCEKNRDVAFDFLKDAIVPEVRGEWVHARGTTLGADNGIGVAAALAAATETDVVHPPLELLFTVDEETGLTGAQGLDGSLLRARTLLNLDSEEDGVLFVGCAGGTDTTLTVTTGRVAHEAGDRPYRLEVSGLKGGHSGLSILENRGNAIKVLAHTLFTALERGIGFQVASLHGGGKHNAIPREAEAVLYVAPGEERKLQAVVDEVVTGFADALRGIDDGLAVRLQPGSGGARVLQPPTVERVLRLLVSLPHGVLGMSPAIPGLVETSSNLAVVETTESTVRIVTSSRSSVAPLLRGVLAQIRAQGVLAGADVETTSGYPGWKPDLNSPVLGVVRRVYAKVWGREPKVTAIHAGLECGLIGEKVPGMDMVSFGPHLENVHSPDERIHVPSVGRFWDALKGVLKELAG